MSINITKEKIITVLRAIKKAGEEKPDNYYTKLFITNENGLAAFDYDELTRIINLLEKDNLIEINHFPKYSTVLADNKPHNKVAPMNYFSLHIEERFADVAKKYGIVPLFLLSLIPSNKKYKDATKIAKLLVNNTQMNNLYLSQTIFKSSSNFIKRRLKKREYFADRKKYNSQLKSKLRALQKLFKPHGYSLSFNKNITKIVYSPQEQKTSLP